MVKTNKSGTTKQTATACLRFNLAYSLPSQPLATYTPRAERVRYVDDVDSVDIDTIAMPTRQLGLRWLEHEKTKMIVFIVHLVNNTLDANHKYYLHIVALRWLFRVSLSKSAPAQ